MRPGAYVLISLVVLQVVVIGYLAGVQNLDLFRTATPPAVGNASNPCGPGTMEPPRLLEPNLSEMRNGSTDTPSYLVRTNRYGLREEPFRRMKASEEIRVLVIGDSFTFGWGVNRSDRFTEVLGRHLEEAAPGRYTVINAGVHGWGMADYYRYLRFNGSRLDPDIVVVAFTRADQLSSDTRMRLFQQAKNMTRRNGTVNDTALYDRLTALKRAYNDRHLSGDALSQSELVCFMHRITATAREERIIPVFYHIWPTPSFTRRIEPYASALNVTFVPPPARFASEPKLRWVHGPEDLHFNRRGHRWAGTHLYRTLVRRGLIPR